MSRIYDNWERLVAATLRRQELWELFHASSRTPSISSRGSDFSFSSALPYSSFEFPSPSSWHQQNSVPEIAVYGRESNVNDEHVLQQLAPEEVLVNGKPLSRRELTMLQSCPSPPKKLERGNYWYDKFSGFWGKQGHKPSQIISAHLDVGGFLDTNVSNGNTLVYINCREITKVELRMLKFAGVRCYRDLHLWMNADGSYQEEGMRDAIGRIWDKVGMKLLCSLLSLPFPSKSIQTSGELSALDNFEQRAAQKILLIGCSGSGTSTIFKQALFLYLETHFLDEVFEDAKLLIKSNMYGYLSILLEGREQFEAEILNESSKNKFADEHRFTGYSEANDRGSIYSFGPRMKAFSDWLLHVTASRNSDVFSASFIHASAPLLIELWSDPAIQETFKRRSELEMLPVVANYFLEHAPDVLKPDFEPSHMDILYTDGFPSSPAYMNFSIPPPHWDSVDSENQQDFARYQLIRSVSNGFEDNNNLLERFEDAKVAIFCISLCDYDQFVINENGASVNKIIHDRKCFERMVTNPIFDQMGCLLLLTKYDLFEEKIKQIPLDRCEWYNDFRPWYSIFHNFPSYILRRLGEDGFHYISVKFKNLYTALTGRKLYVARVNGLELDSIDSALKYAREISKWEEELSEYIYTESSSFYSYSVSDEDS